MKETGKFGFWSIVLLGINGIVGTGIFLLPNKAYSIIGSASLGVLLFDAVIAGCIALCFAEAASLFTRNGGPYLYAKHALGVVDPLALLVDGLVDACFVGLEDLVVDPPLLLELLVPPLD